MRRPMSGFASALAVLLFTKLNSVWLVLVGGLVGVLLRL